MNPLRPRASAWADRPGARAPRVAGPLGGLRLAPFLALPLALLLAEPARAQDDTSGVVRGVVLGGSTELPVASAAVQARGGRWATADENGRFTLRGLPPGPATLRARALGYRPAEQRVVVPRGGELAVTFRLEAAPITLNPVRTVARATERERFELSPDVGAVSLGGRALGQLPAVGEADVLRAVQLLPGVVARSDFSAGYNVRGGEADQNLVLLDGAPVYNPFHLGGLFATFMEPTVRDVTLLTGAFPAAYGGRLSSVLEVTSAEEARQGLHGAASVSLLATTVGLGSALPSAQGTWNVAARRTYADAVAGALTDRVLPYHFRDAHFHGSHLLRGGTLSVTAYDGLDVLDGTFADFGDETGAGAGGGDFRFHWGNRLAGVTLAVPLDSGARIPLGVGSRGLVLGDSSWLIHRLSYSSFGTGIDLGSGSLVFDNRVAEARLAGTLTYHRGAHSWSAGYDLGQHWISFGAESPQTAVSLLSLDQSPLGVALFLEDNWRVSDRLLVRRGVRLEHFTGTSWFGVSPRLSAKYFLGKDLALTAGGGQYAQCLHALRNEDLPVRIFDLWVACDRYVDVSVARHYVGGVESWLSDTRFVRVETYVKDYDRLLELNDADDPLVRGDEFTRAEGHAYGVDVLLRQLDGGRLGGWVAYTYGVSKRRRPDGRWYWPAQDRRHTLNVVATYSPTDRLSFGARFGVASGTPYTNIVGQLVRRVYDPGQNTWDTGISRRQIEPVGGERNGARFPAVHRLDLSVQRRYERGTATLVPYFQIVNAYNRHNVFIYTFDYTANPPTRSALSQFPFLPTLGLKVDF